MHVTFPCSECGAEFIQTRRDRTYCSPDCLRALRRRRYREDPSQRERAYAWARANPDKARESAVKWRSRNEDHLRVYGSQYRADNGERRSAAFKEWAARNPEKISANGIRRRARERNAPGSATPAQVASRVAYFGGRCWMCGNPWEAIDHVKPLNKGGSNWPSNLRPACFPCNSGKRDTWPVPGLFR